MAVSDKSCTVGRELVLATPSRSGLLLRPAVSLIASASPL